MRINTNYAVHGCTNVAGAGCTGATQYDSTGKLTALQNQAYLQVSYHYDGAGRLIDRILSNGAKTRYQYDNDNRLIQLINSSANGTEVENLNYQHDQVGNITQITNSSTNKTTDYQYDALYRLTTVDSTDNTEDRSYSYDKVGNRKTETKNGTTYFYCYHPTDGSQNPQGNRLYNIKTGSQTGTLYRQFSYDNAGRLLQKQDGTGNLIYQVNYNSKGRANSISTSNSTNQFAYDPNDYRIKKDNQLYHLEGEHLEATYSNTGELQNKYLRGVIVDEIVNGYSYHSQAPGDWTNYTFHHDQINSVTALTGHNGTTEETTRYDAFGAILNQTNNTGNDLLFTGRERDQTTGLIYYRARYYDPEIGRFITEDPLGFQAGINFYAYVGNNPVNANDPDGKFANLLIGGSTSVALGYGISLLTGQEYTLADAARDAALGAVGAGIVHKATQLYQARHIAAPLLTKLAANSGSAAQAEITSGIYSFGKGGLSYVGQSGQIGTRLSTHVTSVAKPISSIDNAVRAAVPGSQASREVAEQFTLNSMGGVGGNGVLNLINPIGTARVGLLSSGLGNVTSIATPAQSILNPVIAGAVTGATANASGGFVLYPSKPNTNMMTNVYKK